MGYDSDKAVNHAEKNAKAESQARCATYVREALQAGGLTLTQYPVSAKDYGPTLLANSFEQFHEFKEMAAGESKGPITTTNADCDSDDLIGALTGGSTMCSLIRWTEFNGVLKVPAKPVEKQQGKEKAVEHVPKKGDVVVILPYNGGSAHGHIAIYSGSQWLSDFKQRDMWGGPGYRKSKLTAMIYRPK